MSFEKHRNPNGTYNGVGVMAELTGLTAKTVAELAAWAKANQERLMACPRHDFAPADGPGLRRRVCRNCGGEADNSAVVWYLRGLAHAAMEQK